MKIKLFAITLFMLSFSVLAESNRSFLLKKCSTESRKLIEEVYLGAKDLKVRDMYSWLSGENKQNNEYYLNYAHVLQYQKQNGRFYSTSIYTKTLGFNEQCEVLTLIGGDESEIFPENTENESAIYSEKSCFSIRPEIEKMIGGEHLPKEVCFDQLSFEQSSSKQTLNVLGNPFSGLYDLEFLKAEPDYTKYMTYLFWKNIKNEKHNMSVTLRLSTDIKADNKTIDYIYLAAEFFHYFEDGYETHIYYYRR